MDKYILHISLGDYSHQEKDSWKLYYVFPANQNVYKNMKTGDGFPRIFRCTVDGSVSGRGRPFRFEKRPQKSDSGTDNQKWIAVPSDE